MTGARSVGDRGLRTLLKKKLGKTYNIDETHVDWVIGNGSSKSAPTPITDHEAGIIARVLEVDNIPCRAIAVRGGKLVLVPKIIPARP